MRPIFIPQLSGLLAAACLATPALAHDFWVEPASYWTTPGAATSLTLQVGHGPERQRSRIPLRRVTRFTAQGAAGRSLDLRGGLTLGAGAADGAIRLAAPGGHVLVLQTDNRAQSHLPAARYDAYLEEEGLTPAQSWRAQHHEADREGAEIYSRQAKALVQVGPPGGDQGEITRPVGLTLEIVPERSPYALPRPASLPVRVYFEGRPLAGALVKLTDLDHDAAPLAARRTDSGGRARFDLPRSGRWLLNVVWTKRLPETSEADFETTFSSLSFGLPASR
jgi:uncharacterized GH25 family protein